MKRRILFTMTAMFLSFFVGISFAAKAIINPYASADWGNTTQYKGNFHAHTNIPDGAIAPQDQLNAYASKGYTILALTDHNSLTSWTSLTIPSGFVGINGCETGAPANQTHVGSLFCTYAGSTSDNMAARVSAIISAGGLAVAHHPIRAINAGDAVISDYTTLFNNQYNSNFVGIEVYSNHGSAYFSDAQWDAILTNVFTTSGRNVWGFANDDSHGANQQGYGWNVFPLFSDLVTEESVRSAILQGAFYFSASPQRNGTVPAIKSIDVDELNLKIKIVLTDATSASSTIKWYTDGGTVVKNTSGTDITSFEIDCGSIQSASTRHYVRAVISNGTNKTYTQPFALKDIIEVNTIQDLFNVRNGLKGYYQLTKDLDFNDFSTSYDASSYPTPPAGYSWSSASSFKDAITAGEGWAPISDFFTGVFNGNGYTISNLYINKTVPPAVSTYGMGLFSGINSGGKIINLNVSGDITVADAISESNAILAGSVYEGGYVYNCTVSGTISAEGSYDGGLTGANGGLIQKSSSSATVDCRLGRYEAVGGISGSNYGVVVACKSSGMVTGYWAGGIIGSNGGSIRACKSSAACEGMEAGGIVGRNSAKWSTIINCGATGTITGSVAGGLVGANSEGKIMRCFSNSTVIVQYGGPAGGLVGLDYLNSGSITDCYATGTVQGLESYGFLGGLVGENTCQIQNCYAAVTFSGGGTIGGLVASGNASNVTSSYWDNNLYTGSSSGGGTGKTTTEMKQQSTFSGWNFTATGIWTIESSYPALKWQDFDFGDGTRSAPFSIEEQSSLKNVLTYQGPQYSNTYFELDGDISLTYDMVLEDDWVPVGTENAPFQGHFNGNGYTISGLKITTPNTNYVGLFGYIGNNGIVENVNVQINSGDEVCGNVFVGSIAGWNGGVIRKCSVIGAGLIKGSGNSVGGITGRIGFGGKVTDCFSHTAVKGDQNVGGLVGAVEYGSLVSTSYSKGLVSKLNPWSSSLGGLIGSNWGGTISGSYWDNQTSGQTSSAGGAGKTTAQMKQQTTFTGWDFVNIWNITSGSTYPFFR